MLQNFCLPYTVKYESHHLYWNTDRNFKMCEQSKAGRKSERVIVVRLPCIPPKDDFMAPKAVNRSACTCAHNIEMLVQAQAILMKRLLHNSAKANETLSNYLPHMCRSCNFNLPSASNFPPEHVSIFCSHVWEVVLTVCLPPRGQCAWTCSPKIKMTAPSFKQII